MLRDFARIFCLAMLLAGTSALRSMHAMSHAGQTDHASCTHAGETISGPIAGEIAACFEDSSDHHQAPNPLQSHHCGVCDELAAATNDAGLNCETMIVAQAEYARDEISIGQACDIESPRVALANPPPSI
ncbi:MAG: hypothetical protein K8R92_01140 [Planctomycetes bacterium]|nr:hypothetical protein [Planctomycetota bacterium]